VPETARVAITDAEIDQAIEQARQLEKFDRRVLRASYSEITESIVLILENGVTISIPRRLLQGLTEAGSLDLANIELLGRGTGLYWPSLDVAHLAEGLLDGIYGSAKWMERLNLEKHQKQISA